MTHRTKVQPSGPDDAASLRAQVAELSAINDELFALLQGQRDVYGELIERTLLMFAQRGYRPAATALMTIRQAITHLPEVKPHVVAGQIHDAEDDVVMIRLEEANLFVEGGGEDLGTLDPAYVLGSVFTIRVEASGGEIRIAYNDGAPIVVTRSGDGMYFKAGCYTQSNTDRGDDAAAYGEVVIYDLTVEHR